MEIPVARNPAIQSFLREKYDDESLEAIRDLLRRKGTLSFKQLKSGLFSAAETTEYSQGTNYHAVWVGDNVHVAYAHLVDGEPQVAVLVARAMCKFFATQKAIFADLHVAASLPELYNSTYERPHIRF